MIQGHGRAQGEYGEYNFTSPDQVSDDLLKRMKLILHYVATQYRIEHVRHCVFTELCVCMLFIFSVALLLTYGVQHAEEEEDADDHESSE